MNRLWADFLRYAARRSKAGEVRAFEGVEAAWVNSTLPFFNGMLFTEAPTDGEDVARRIEAAKRGAGARGLPWVLYTYDRYFAGHPIPAESGLERVLGLQVMTGDAAGLKAPVRALPGVEFRRAMDEAVTRDVLDINVQVYGLQPEMTDSFLATRALYADPSREFGYVAYVNGEAVSTTTVVLVEGWLYVALVATAAGHQKRGYAEAVMRHALAEAAAATGVTRTSLDASDAGAPLYAQMGYEATGETWGVWMASH